MSKFELVLVACMIACASGVIQQITIYTGPNKTGESITFREKIRDLSPWKNFLSRATYYCANGWYDFYPSTNYIGASKTFGGQGGDGEETKCGNASFVGLTGSARFTGPCDIRTPAVTFIQGTPGNNFGGEEIVVEGSGRGYINLSQTKVVYSHGRSNWTLYTEDNFRVSSRCFQEDGSYIHYELLNDTFHVRSVRRGCDGDQYFGGHHHHH